MTDLNRFKIEFEQRLEQLLPPVNRADWKFNIGEVSPVLADAMRYSLFAGGKRIRPMMFLTAVDLLGGSVRRAMDLACAIEMIHTYSLIHDDLPGMDNDSLRRGKATNHIVFGEGQAILAGDGLLNYAYEVMLKSVLSSNDPQEIKRILSAINEIAHGAGITGMIAGQAEDLYAEDMKSIAQECLSFIQTGKTSCMFAYPLRAAGRLSGCDNHVLKGLSEFGTAYGLLFQATDDLLDVTGDAEQLGKSTGKDVSENKMTCVSVYGIEGTRAFIDYLSTTAIRAACDAFGDNADVFIQLVHQTVTRVS